MNTVAGLHHDQSLTSNKRKVTGSLQNVSPLKRLDYFHQPDGCNDNRNTTKNASFLFSDGVQRQFACTTFLSFTASSQNFFSTAISSRYTSWLAAGSEPKAQISSHDISSDIFISITNDPSSVSALLDKKNIREGDLPHIYQILFSHGLACFLAFSPGRNLRSLANKSRAMRTVVGRPFSSPWPRGKLE